MDTSTATRSVTFPAPAGYETAFRIKDARQAETAQAGSAQALAQPMREDTKVDGVASNVGNATVAVNALKSVDYTPMGVGEVAAVVMIGLVIRHLRRAPERIRALAPRESARPSRDEDAERSAFEARYGRGRL